LSRYTCWLELFTFSVDLFKVLDTEQEVKVSFRLTGTATSAAITLLTSGKDLADWTASPDKLKAIWMQKWLALVIIMAWRHGASTGEQFSCNTSFGICSNELESSLASFLSTNGIYQQWREC